MACEAQRGEAIFPQGHTVKRQCGVENQASGLSVRCSVHGTLWPPSATMGPGKEGRGDWLCWVGGRAPNTPGQGTRGPMLMGDQRESSRGEGTDGGVRWGLRYWVSVSPLVPKGCSRPQDQGREAADKSPRSTSPQACLGGACQWFWVVLLNFLTSEKRRCSPTTRGGLELDWL